MNCQAEEVACFGPPVDPWAPRLRGLIACVEVCEDQNCTRRCIIEGSQEGFDAAVALDRCVFTDNACADRESDCAINNCGALITACFGEAVCGNGRREVGEACDDGNDNPEDGCDRACQSVARCGDGIVDDGEACDDGNNVDGDGCAANCVAEAPADLSPDQLSCRAIGECFGDCAPNDGIWCRLLPRVPGSGSHSGSP